MENYRIIEVAKERIVGRATVDDTELEPVDVVGKVEIKPNREIYMSGYTDYHEGQQEK